VRLDRKTKPSARAGATMQPRSVQHFNKTQLRFAERLTLAAIFGLSISCAKVHASPVQDSIALWKIIPDELRGGLFATFILTILRPTVSRAQAQLLLRHCERGISSFHSDGYYYYLYTFSKTGYVTLRSRSSVSAFRGGNPAMEFSVKKFDLLQELSLTQGVVERKTTIRFSAHSVRSLRQ